MFGGKGIKVRPNRNKDILYMHADDELTPQASGAGDAIRRDLRESLAIHLLYFGRVLVPLPFLLDNPELASIFQGDLASDAYRLIKRGDLLPVIHGSTVTGIRDYANSAIERRMRIHIKRSQFLHRANLIDELPRVHEPDLDFREAFKRTFYDLTRICKLNDHELVEFLPSRVASIEKTDRLLTRTDVYKATDRLDISVRKGLRTIADTAYYCAYADGLGINPAIPEHCSSATLVNYHRSGGPLFYSPGAEDRDFMMSIPDFSTVPLADLLEDLGDCSERKAWLAVLREIQRGKKSVEMDLIREKARALTDELKRYVNERVGTRRKSETQILKKAKVRKFQFERCDYIRGLVYPVATFAFSVYSQLPKPIVAKGTIASLLVSLAVQSLKGPFKRRLTRVPPPLNCIPAVASFSLRARGLRK